jgi:hypothetical protein
MSLADDLKTLQELHEKGKLTDQEYADAKASTLKLPQAAGSATPQPLFKWRLRVLVLVLLALLVLVWYNVGTRNTTRLIATAVHAPVTLTDDVQNVPAHSWKAVGINIPYSGTVSVNVAVVRGNPVDVFLTTPDQLDAMKQDDWRNVKVYGDFNATKTTTYQRTSQLAQGGYYLVLRDTSLGILSSSASDISVKAQLNP